MSAGVHASDLPPAVRKKLGLDTDTTGGGGRKKPSRAGIGLSAPCPGHCGCGQPFPTASAWEKHATRTGEKHATCRRWAIDLGDRP